MKIKDLPINSRPREKALLYGFETLSDVELLAIIIGSGVKNKSAIDIAESLLIVYPNLAMLAETDYASILNQYGLSKAKALKLYATFQLFRRINQKSIVESSVIETASDAYKIYQKLCYALQEVMLLILLDNKNRIKKEITLYKGTRNSLLINVRDVMLELLRSDANKFILIHNHPNGYKEPSDNDIKTTYLLIKETAKYDIKMIDHIIIFEDGYYSFNDNKVNVMK